LSYSLTDLACDSLAWVTGELGPKCQSTLVVAEIDDFY